MWIVEYFNPIKVAYKRWTIKVIKGVHASEAYLHDLLPNTSSLNLYSRVLNLLTIFSFIHSLANDLLYWVKWERKIKGERVRERTKARVLVIRFKKREQEKTLCCNYWEIIFYILLFHVSFFCYCLSLPQNFVSSSHYLIYYILFFIIDFTVYYLYV